MFLNELDLDEKRMFLRLADHLVAANGVVEEQEKNLINQYCFEMGLPMNNEIDPLPMSEIICLFQKRSESVKCVTIMELLGLGYIDGEYDEVEQSMMKSYVSDIGVSDEVYEKLRKDVEEYIYLVDIIKNHIFE